MREQNFQPLAEFPAGEYFSLREDYTAFSRLIFLIDSICKLRLMGNPFGIGYVGFGVVSVSPAGIRLTGWL